MVPPTVLPMKATAGPLPTGDEWVYEVKWDGMRALARVTAETVSLTSANGKDATTSFPELGRLATLGVGSALLDGEIVALDDEGRPDFGRLQQRMHVTSPREAATRAATVPAVYLVFDLLELDGRSLVELAWEQRRGLLDQLVAPGPNWRCSEVHDDGPALLDAARTLGLEGVIAKRRSSRYRPGSRSRDWVKVKIRRRQELVVGGWASGRGSRSGRIGGLLVGYHDKDGDGDPVGWLTYAGRVGSGLTDAEIAELRALFEELATDACPFVPEPPPDHRAGARWVRPEVVVEVAYAEWTSEGRLRHPTYCGRRIDSVAAEVTAEP